MNDTLNALALANEYPEGCSCGASKCNALEADNLRLRECMERAERNLRRAIRNDILGDSFACGVADDLASVLANASGEPRRDNQ